MYRYITMILILIVSGCAMHFQSSIPLVKVRVALKYDKPYPLKNDKSRRIFNYCK